MDSNLFTKNEVDKEDVKLAVDNLIINLSYCVGGIDLKLLQSKGIKNKEKLIKIKRYYLDMIANYSSIYDIYIDNERDNKLGKDIIIKAEASYVGIYETLNLLGLSKDSKIKMERRTKEENTNDAMD